MPNLPKDLTNHVVILDQDFFEDPFIAEDEPFLCLSESEDGTISGYYLSDELPAEITRRDIVEVRGP